MLVLNGAAHMDANIGQSCAGDVLGVGPSPLIVELGKEALRQER